MYTCIFECALLNHSASNRSPLPQLHAQKAKAAKRIIKLLKESSSLNLMLLCECMFVLININLLEQIEPFFESFFFDNEVSWTDRKFTREREHTNQQKKAGA